MLTEIIVTYIHFLGFISIFVALAVEKVLLKKELSIKETQLIRKSDALYGIASILMLATGFAKMYWFGKGMDYYMHNHIFWTKIMLFSIVGILSIYPTITFMKWKKITNKDNAIELTTKQFKRLNRLIVLELIFMVSIPLCAHIMARGIGYIN